MSLCTAGADSKALLDEVLSGVTFNIPTFDPNDKIYDIPTSAGELISAPITPVDNAALVSGATEGMGTFDAIASAIKSLLREEYDAGRITGAEYTKTYAQLLEAALGNATQFLLQRDQAKWQAVQAQLGAITARVQLAQAKIQAASFFYDANTARARYGLTVMQAGSESINYCTGKYNLSEILPVNKALLESQKSGQDIQNNTGTFQLQQTLPQQLILLKEQTETQRSQTMDNRTDGAQVSGVIGIQKDLNSAQIKAYTSNSQLNAAKLFTDAWATIRSTDDQVQPPNQFVNSEIDEVLVAIRSSNNLGS